jgi:hypothetical protein
MSNSRADHYRPQADYCRLQAERSKHIDHNESWMKLAAQWLQMAEESTRLVDNKRSSVKTKRSHQIRSSPLPTARSAPGRKARDRAIPERHFNSTRLAEALAARLPRP